MMHCPQKLHRRHRIRCYCPGKHIPNYHIPARRTETISHRAGITHPNLQPGCPRHIKPFPHQPGQLRIQLHHRLPRLRIHLRKIPRQRTRPTAQMRHPQLSGIQPGINNHLTTSGNPPHILILQLQRIWCYVARRHPIDKHLPAAGNERIRPQLHLTRRRGIHPSNRTRCVPAPSCLAGPTSVPSPGRGNRFRTLAVLRRRTSGRARS